MAARTNRQWLLAARPSGMVKESDFRWQEEPVRELLDGEILVRTLYLSFDPAMRGWMDDRRSYLPPVQIGEPMRAGAVGQVVESRSRDFAPGDLVQGTFGWQDYAIVGGKGVAAVTKLPKGIPLTWPLGVLGITGLTAYFGILEVGKPKAGETVVVSGAAGATGSVAAQIAKIVGARVIGIAGGDEKCRWLRDQAKLDGVVDYKRGPVDAALRELCPNGIDVYFDNVGGAILDACLAQLALKARVVLCGGISAYNEKEQPAGPRNYLQLIIRRSRMEGFLVLDYAARFPDAIRELTRWVEAGKVQHQEDVQHGLENAPRTFLRLFTGENRGKQLLKVADPPVAIG
ncbi:MAG TPA: NADP-dependent oxidoreductase [Myxococcota bacterium]|jgi:NADPH-dependent curcumin reductase CurA|nr:NADP-dependent oxidoreductase [Myxococcota bacterium]